MTIYAISYAESTFEPFSVWNKFFRWKVGQYKYRTWLYTLYRMGSPDLRRFPSEITFSGEKSANLNLGHEYIRYIVWGVHIWAFSVWNNFFRWKVGQFKSRTWLYTLYRMGSPDLSRFPSEITFSGEKSVNINIGHEYIRYIAFPSEISYGLYTLYRMGVQIWDVFRLK